MKPSALTRKEIALACSIIAAQTIARTIADPWLQNESPTLFAFGANLIIAAYARKTTIPLIATAINLAICDFLFIQPRISLEIQDPKASSSSSSSSYGNLISYTILSTLAILAFHWRNKQKSKLEEAESIFKAFFDQSPVGKAQADPHTGTTLKANKSLCELLGYTSQQLVGKRFSDIVDPQHKEEENQSIHDLLERGNHQDQRIYHTRKGTQKWVLINAILITDREQNPLYTLNVIQDIDDSVKIKHNLQEDNNDLESRIAARTQELTAAHKELQSFCFSVSHDLRAPLRAILSNSTILQEDFGEPIGQEGEKYLESIKRAAAKMNQMIDDILNFAKQGNQPIHREDIDLSRLAHHLAEHIIQINPRMKKAFYIQEGLTACVDPTLIRAVLENLLSNAAKFAGKKEDPAILFGKETTQHKGKSIQAFYVSDNGVGLDPEQAAKKLFQPFERFHRESEFPGTGIGLASAHKIIERHQGEIWCQSQPQQGATFYFTIHPLQD